MSSPPTHPIGILRLKLPDGKDRRIPIDKPTLTIGRASANDLVIDHPSVSRFHARLKIIGSKPYLEDLGSSNGSYIGNRRLNPHHPEEFQPGQRILIGSVELRYRSGKKPWMQMALAGGVGLTVLIFLCLSLIAFVGFLVLRWGRRGRIPVCQELPMTMLTGAMAGVSSPTQVAIPPTGESGSAQPSPSPLASAAPLTPLPLSPTPETGEHLLPTAPPSRPIEGLAFLELPFPYDGGNTNFGGTLEQFKRASQRSGNAGRINSFFDHFYPLYPASNDPAIPGGEEPAEPPIGKFILIFSGELSRQTNYSGHPAYDFSTYEHHQPTTPVFAAADGVIARVGVHSASGALFVKINHTVPGVGDFQTIYWHLHPDEFFEAMKGREGERITAGTRVGTMGNTGWSTGHHLHFEVRFDRNRDGYFSNREVVDPYGYLPAPDYPVDPWYDRAKLLSRYLWAHSLGGSAEVPSDGAGQLDQPGDSGDIGSTVPLASLCAQQGSLPPGGQVFWSWAPDPPATSSTTGTGNGCSLTAFDEYGNPVDHFAPPIGITLPFEESDLINVDPATLAIYWRAGADGPWEALPTIVDLEAHLAYAETDRPGQCSLMGEPLGDQIAPETDIQVSGDHTGEGFFYGPVTVTLSSSDPSGISRIEYSLDSGTTWQEYSSPFTLEPSGIPSEVPAMEGEGFPGGPGHYLVLASATDGNGNVEDPPAYRRITINPLLGPPASSASSGLTPTPTPTRTPEPGTPTQTPTPTSSATFTPTPTESPQVCAITLTLEKNAFCRSGPGTIYGPLTAFESGTTLQVDGQSANSMFKWWWVLIPNTSAHCWVSDSLVAIKGGADTSCLAVIPAPPTPTPTPSLTFPPPHTFTPTPTATATNPPPDTVPPPAPALIAPLNATLPCASTVVLEWTPVSDPSGIKQYDWVIERSTTGSDGPYSVLATGSTSGISATPVVSCGLWYRWRVRAVDGKNNIGAYSGYGFFSIIITLQSEPGKFANPRGLFP